jgi:hypothetical protein
MIWISTNRRTIEYSSGYSDFNNLMIQTFADGISLFAVVLGAFSKFSKISIMAYVIFYEERF